MPVTKPASLSAVEITSAFHVQELRLIRNICADGFTSFNGHISRRQQADWWQSMQGRIKGWLYWDREAQWYVGFGVLREAEGKWWNSIGVNPVYRGHGYGSLITQDLISKHPEPIYSVVKRDNPSAVAMHHKDCWEEIEGHDTKRLIYLRSLKPSETSDGD